MNKKSASQYHRIVVKLGTNLLTGGTDHLDEEAMSRLGLKYSLFPPGQ